MSEPTKGPWKASPVSSVVGSLVTSGDQNVAAVIPRLDKAETEANAALIASAPDLQARISRYETAMREALMITELFVACRKRPDMLHPKYSCTESNGEADTVVSYDRKEGEHLDDVCGRCKLLKVLRAALAGATSEEGGKETQR